MRVNEMAEQEANIKRIYYNVIGYFSL